MLKAKITALMGFDSLVSELGGNPSSFLKPYDISADDLKNQHKYVPLQSLVSLLHQAADDLNCPEFGMRLGASQDFSVLGESGKAIVTSPTLLDALYAARSVNTYHNQAEYWRPILQGTHICFRRYDLFRQIHDTRQYKEMAMAACFNMGRVLLNDEFLDIAVEFEHSPLSTPELYRKYFSHHVRFNCEQDQLVIDKSLTDKPLSLPSTNETSLIAIAAPLPVQDLANIEQDVSILIQQLLSSGNLSIERVASMMAMSKRTLQRKLKAQGIEFKHLVESLRIEKACWYLISSEIDITLISEIVGYTDTANFSRAFKRVMGKSPRSWRKLNK